MHDLDRTQMELEQPEVGEQEASPYELAPRPPLDEVEEMELASELLELQDEAEIEQFLDSLLGRAAAAGRFLCSDDHRILIQQLKDIARKVLPATGRGAGQWVAPDIGWGAGALFVSQASAVLGLELEGLSAEDSEFELARQFVRLANAAAEEAALAPPGAPPGATAQAALAAAARRYAPGLGQELLAGETEHGGRRRQARTGRWMRRGRTIVLIDV
jgi:hypothetical protein